jgi:hypothetical protein
MMTQIPPDSIPRSSRDVAEENELSALKLVHSYGHVRRTEIACAMWPNSPAPMPTKMAQRTVRRLTRKNQLVDVPNILEGRSLLLAKNGAARLRAWGIDARRGGDMSSIMGAQFAHRMLGTCYLIDREVQGHNSFGEHAIANGQAPVSRHELERRFHKIPDGLVLLPAIDRGYAQGGLVADWIEVESARKSFKELSRILALVWQSGVWLDDSQSIMLDRVVFVYDQRQHHEETISKALARYMLAHPPGDPRLLLSGIAFARCKISAPLVWHGCDEVDGNALLDAGKLPVRITK